jgi:hypothetical protein
MFEEHIFQAAGFSSLRKNTFIATQLIIEWRLLIDD